MSHTIYHTEAIVLALHPAGEADQVVHLFTHEFGRVTAIAQSARRERSKLRYALQPYTYSTVALVRGRELWRLTGAAVVEQLPRSEAPARQLMQRFSMMVLRLIHGEEHQPELFALCKNTISLLRSRSLSAEELRDIEVLVMFQLCILLGYGLAQQTSVPSQLQKPTTAMIDLLPEVAIHRKLMINHVNEALAASQL